MWILWFWSLLVAALIGLALKYGVDYGRKGTTSVYQISWLEFAIVMALIAIVVIPVTTKVGLSMAKASKLKYHEFWGGYETAVLTSSGECHRDGSCEDSYNCDPYEVPYQVTDYDSKGNPSGSHTEYRTEYHDCPVATRENYWAIDTTLGKYSLGMTFDKNAVAWRSSHGLDSTFQGHPLLWDQARARLAAGDPGPVTADKTYDNYILASTKTILHKFSDAVDKYKAAKLLPYPITPLGQPIYNHYYGDKMSFVGLPGVDQPTWQFALSRLNAALGSSLQGDLHVVAINADKVPNADEYAGAVNAYWQDKTLGRRALSKNGIGLVLGVKDGTIAWARSFTGMPVGNDGLTLDLQNGATGAPFTPDIFGHAVGHIKSGKVVLTHGVGPVEQALWGPHAFKRVCMVCKTKGDTGVGYGYLGSEIQPSSGQKWAISLVAIFFAILFWGAALATTIGEKKETR